MKVTKVIKFACVFIVVFMCVVIILLYLYKLDDAVLRENAAILVPSSKESAIDNGGYICTYTPIYCSFTDSLDSYYTCREKRVDITPIVATHSIIYKSNLPFIRNFSVDSSVSCLVFDVTSGSCNKTKEGKTTFILPFLECKNNQELALKSHGGYVIRCNVPPLNDTIKVYYNGFCLTGLQGRTCLGYVEYIRQD